MISFKKNVIITVPVTLHFKNQEALDDTLKDYNDVICKTDDVEDMIDNLSIKIAENEDTFIEGLGPWNESAFDKFQELGYYIDSGFFEREYDVEDA